MRRCNVFVRAVVGVLATVLLPIGCSQSGPATSIGDAERKNAEIDEFVIGEGISQGNITVFPVSTRVLHDADRFLTLDQGLKEGLVEIQELGAASSQASHPDDPNGAELAAQQAPPVFQANGSQTSDADASTNSSATTNDEPQSVSPHADQASASEANLAADANPLENPFGASVADSAVDLFGSGADVNRLAVINRSDRPLYLMPGEIVVGGQQDRAIGQEYIIEAKTGPVPIEVFCVEHGRWNEKAAEQLDLVISQSQSTGAQGETIALTPAANTAKMAAEESAQGRFVASVGSLGKQGRVAVQDSASQSEVWSKVAQENEKSGVSDGNQTGAFTDNYASEKVVARLEPLMAALKDPVAKTANVVGVVVAINGKVESMDVFEATPLFQKLWPKLLKSYCLDAVNADQAATETAKCTRDDARKFLIDAAAQPSDATLPKEGIAGHRGDQAVLFSLHDRRADNSPAAGASEMGGGFAGGGFGGAVHAAGFSK